MKGRRYDLVPYSPSYHAPTPYSSPSFTQHALIPTSSLVQSPSVSYHSPTPVKNEIIYRTQPSGNEVMDPMIPGGGYIDMSEYMEIMSDMGKGI